MSTVTAVNAVFAAKSGHGGPSSSVLHCIGDAEKSGPGYRHRVWVAVFHCDEARMIVESKIVQR